MSIVAKHNYTTLEGTVIRTELHPHAKYNEMHEVYVEVAAEVALKKYIKDHDVKFIWIKNVGPHVQDFWVPPVIKGNVIAVPINVASAASTSVGRAVTSPAKVHADWCNSAFVAYETLYNMSARSAQGKVSISTMAWGSQLDISTFRMHYGSRFNSFEQRSSIPVVSSSIVEMRQYGDKDSAAEVLSIRHNGRVNDNSDAITEGINMTAKGTILSMNLEAKEQQGNLWMDVKRMDVCSVDREGVLAKWDLTRAVTSDSKFPLPEDKSVSIDLEHEFYACSVSLHETDSTVLTVSDRHSQVVRWDMRANGPVQSSLSCLRRVNREPSDRYKGVKLRSTMPHPLIGCEWSPHNPHEFMTTSLNAIRIWDVRKMTDDLHCRFFDIGDKIQKAQWSPHKPDVFGILGHDGLLRITKLQIPQVPHSPSSYFDVLPSEELFVHLGHTLCVTDFSWCPYLEDVICTVAAGFDREPGGIQVWRPRNLYDSNENEEP
ncbi:Histone-binding protein rbbp4 [Podila minutissima]|nr:Histone-binding protein rbbp4 [Podila minutissima]